jgi:dCMP deaminase
MMHSSSSSLTRNPYVSKWDSRFLRIAEEVANWSKDPGTKVGCVIVKDRRILATGYNGFPSGLSDDLSLYLNRDYKLSVVVHAEKNAFFNAAKTGANTENSTVYVTFPPCSQCASAMIQAGVVNVYCPDPVLSPPRWRPNFILASNLLVQAGLKITYYTEADLYV